MKQIAAALLITLCAVLSPSLLQAHALDPGYVEITENEPENYRVFWRKPDVRGDPMAISLRLPEHCDIATPPTPWFDGVAWISDWTTRCEGGITDSAISVPGLQNTRTDVIVRVQLGDTSAVSTRLTPQEITYAIPAHVSTFSVLLTYIELGIEHILEGFDHLLFVFALVVLIRNRWRLLGAITAFTLAHSITLALASLNIVRVPAPPVEAVIALSIVFLAVEIAKQNAKPRLSEQWPWVVSFAFGLLHGLGFAGALREIGLPDGDIFVALLGFNIGVEIGQVLFVVIVLGVFALSKRVLSTVGQVELSSGQAFRPISSYLIGSIASFWLVERVVGFF